MDTGNYTIKKFLSFENLEQLVIPELQRDYVWQKEHILDLLSTFHNGFIGDEQDQPYLGFIYAYNDKDYVYKYFVVDGQQRLTSIYLIMILCYQLSNKPIPSYLNNLGKLKLDYKVRQSTHDFLHSLIEYCGLNLSEHDFIIEDQVWYHSNYENDRTVINLIENFNAVRSWLKEYISDELPDFTKYLENKVQFSYFDIENGREGEELYIYMNSRGKQLEINETLKAKFLATESDEKKLDWGRKWEEWQDFFWRSKGKNPDADVGFDEFLRRVQIINMCSIGKTNEQISNFSSEKSDLKIGINFLPKSLEEIEAYFNAFRIMAESPVLKDFYNKYESSNNYLNETPPANKRQTYYFVTLPILAFVKESSVVDQQTIVRFVRFFYNISRKLNIGKDISTQLPSAIKLIQEYILSKPILFDVVGLRFHSRNRTVLLDEEEIFKLKSFATPPTDSNRDELENLFWTAEDHIIFKGEIGFLLENDKEKPEYEICVDRMKKYWSTFVLLYPNSNTRLNNSSIVSALLFYGNTWHQDSPYYYKNYNCADWPFLVKQPSRKYLKSLLKDMHGESITHLDYIIKSKISEYFHDNHLTTVDALKSLDSFFDQAKAYVSLDYYSRKVLWDSNNFYFAEDERFNMAGTFFTKNRLIYNVHRYIYNDDSRIVYRLMEIILLFDEKVQKIINQILEEKEMNS